MKRAWLCVPFLASVAFAQSTDKLTADLLAMNGTSIAAASQQLANDILSLAEANAQPSRRVVLDFTEDLTRALIGKSRTAENASQLSAAIVDILHSSGVVTRKYRATLDLVRQNLAAMGVTDAVAQRVAGRLSVLGQEIRGPEDLPVVNAPRLK